MPLKRQYATCSGSTVTTRDPLRVRLLSDLHAGHTSAYVSIREHTRDPPRVRLLSDLHAEHT